MKVFYSEIWTPNSMHNISIFYQNNEVANSDVFCGLW